MTKLRIYQLDLFRFIAAMMVVFHHYLFIGPQVSNYSVPNGVIDVSRYGYFGVEWFFIISGFVIVMSAENQTWRSFLRGRFSRLFPLFWVACTLTFVGVPLLGGAARITSTFPTYLANMGMVLPHFLRTDWVDSSYWTLTYEWAFYAGIASLLRFEHFDRRLPQCMFAWLAVAMGLLLFSTVNAAPLERALRLATLADYAPYFVAGVCFYKLHQRRMGRLDLYNLLFSYLLAIKSATLHAEEHWAQFHNPISAGVAQVCVTVLFVIFLLFSLGKLEFLNRRAFLKLGVLTYSVYLVHQFLGYALLGKLVPILGLWGGIAITTAAAITTGALLHYWVEKPFHRLLKPKH